MKEFLAITCLRMSLPALLVLGHMALADDWPQFRGVYRDGVWHETGIVTRFPKDGLPIHSGAL